MNRSLEPYAPSANLSAILETDAQSKNPSAKSNPGRSESNQPEVVLSPEDQTEADENTSYSDRFMHLTKDSLGNMRYLGGASSFVLVEALKSIRQPSSQSPGSNGEGLSKGAANLELPFFRPGVRELPYLSSR